ncbi:MAG: shikimate kinase [Bacteroidetes bacterium]|nr:MAG: shikimate kinase [Bacteroidota bacterium]TAF91665.1 MAG: shikimate kinase [Bacteroidota bacterium]
MSIFLVGLMGSGKTTIGKALATHLHWPFTDTDAEIARNQQLSIPEIFEQKGENYFRNAEAEWVKNCQSPHPQVIATGGGLPCFGNTMELLLQKGFVLFLNVPTHVLAKRLVQTQELKNRPLLAGKSEQELHHFLTLQLQARYGFYSRAHATVSSSTISLQQILKAYHHYAKK